MQPLCIFHGLVIFVPRFLLFIVFTHSYYRGYFPLRVVGTTRAGGAIPSTAAGDYRTTGPANERGTDLDARDRCLFDTHLCSADQRTTAGRRTQVRTTRADE